MAFEALWRYPLRTIMMLIATAIGVAAVLILTSLGEGARRFVTAEFSSLGTHLVIVFPGRSETSGANLGMMITETPRDLTIGDAQALLRSPHVEKAAPVMVGSAPISYGGLERETTIMGSTSELISIRQWDMLAGEFIPGANLERAAPVCTIGAEIKQELFGSTQAVGKWLRVGDRRCRVTGVLSKAGHSVGINVDEIVVLPVLSAQALLNSESLFRIIVAAPSPEAMNWATNDIKRIIRDRHFGEEDITVVTQDAVLNTFDSIFQVLTMALGGIASVSLLVAGILIMNVMLVAVSQRTPEIGLLKALGAKSGQVTLLFLTEALFLSVSGAILGTIVGYAAILAARSFYPILDFTPPAWAIIAAFGVAVCSGILFGILPARKAARLDPVTALSGR
jgi:putative ABC transport system permease protein